MPKINLLDKQVAELIAAGEVVERPASIVKELVENAIDAGASAVTVEIQGGGVRYIRVTDNGSGIEREDIATAFLRHATSKVRVCEDLNHITTMGFRGEALASIAAMCRVEVLTRTKDETAGTLYAISAGEEEHLEDAGCPVGTTISVRDVFFNTPARMKFLKKDVSEGNSVAAVIEKAALANPKVAFKFIREGAVKLQTPGDGKCLSAIRCVLGREFAEHAIPVSYTNEGLEIQGFICKPSIARASRSMQNFFINNRFVRSKTCMAALEEAYKNTLMVGRFPSCVLNVLIPPDSVDVNVHPAKIEVRFSDERSIFNLVYYACKSALSSAALMPEIQVKDVKAKSFAYQFETNFTAQERPDIQEIKAQQAAKISLKERSAPALQPAVLECSYPSISNVNREQPVIYSTEQSFIPVKSFGFSDVSAAAALELSQTDDRPSADLLGQKAPTSVLAFSDESTPRQSIYADAAIVGELFHTYILLQCQDRILMVDKHAAHERILFNQLMREGIGEARQLLISPVSVQLSAEEYTAVLENINLLSQAGITAEDFGDGFVIVREIAPVMSGLDVESLVVEFAQKLLNASSRLFSEQLEDIYHMIACKAAIKSGDHTAILSLAQLISLLDEDKDASHCPHGRPVSIAMSRYEIDKKFGRLG